jgi:hypothetical protein
MPDDATKHSMWANVAKQILSFVVGVIVAAFILGRNSQKINEVVTWKGQVAPLIEHMNRSGTVSFEHFFVQYEKTQTTQEKKLDDLDKRVREFERKIDP